MGLICFWYIFLHCPFSLDSYLKIPDRTAWEHGKSCIWNDGPWNLLVLSLLLLALFLNIGWYFRYALVLITMYNVWDLIGRYIPLIKCLMLSSRKGLTIGIIARFLLIPAFYFTAKYGDQGWMIMLTSFLGLTNGYFTVCVLTSAPKGYKVSWFMTFLVGFSDLREGCRGSVFSDWIFVSAGTGTKCSGKHPCVFPSGRDICWGYSWLVVAHRQGMVTGDHGQHQSTRATSSN